MSCFLTQGRLALIDALKADATLGARVRTWYDFGPGLQKRYEILPAACPLCSVVPAELDDEQLTNAAAFVAQDVEIGIATDGQDCAPCEELVAAALDVVRDANDTALGLAAEGLLDLAPVSLSWQPVETKEASRIRWEARIVVRVRWARRT